MEEKNFSGKFVLKTALIVMCVSVIVSIVLTLMAFNSFFSEIYSGYGELFAVNKLIQDNFYGDYNKEIAEYEACKGLVKGLNDPYAGFYSSEDLEMLMGSISSDYVGIGVTVTSDSEGLLIVDVNENGPAKNAGIVPGDIITHVDGKSVIGIGEDETLKIIKTGKVGTEVLVTVVRDNISYEFSVERVDLYDDPVSSEMIGTVAYITVKQFNIDTGDRFDEVLKEAEDNGATALVLDLRNNPGGESEACEEVADLLLDKGIMYYSVDKSGKKDVVYTKDGSNKLPLAVLVNGNTASASELVTGALKDAKRGCIIGQTTYGKGVIQGIYTIGNDSALKITVAEYFTPSGYAVQKNGIEPDVAVEPADNMIFGDVEHDNQLVYALDYLKKELGE